MLSTKGWAVCNNTDPFDVCLARPVKAEEDMCVVEVYQPAPMKNPARVVYVFVCVEDYGYHSLKDGWMGC